MEWLPLVNESQLQDLLEASRKKPVLIFKHSTRCSVSMMVKRGFETAWKGSNDTFPAYFLDLLSYRSVSDKIADTLDVEHQSPQLIVVKDGKAVYNASHEDIDAAEVLAQG